MMYPQHWSLLVFIIVCWINYFSVRRFNVVPQERVRLFSDHLNRMDITVTPLGAGQDVGRSCLLLTIGPPAYSHTIHQTKSHNITFVRHSSDPDSAVLLDPDSRKPFSLEAVLWFHNEFVRIRIRIQILRYFSVGFRSYLNFF
jgi:hypothetical protein